MITGIIKMEFVAFVIVHFICFVIYTSKYTMTVQDANVLRRKLNVKGVDKELIIQKIKELDHKTNKLKRISMFIPLSIFSFHVLFLLISTGFLFDDILHAFCLFIGIALLFLIANWIKGAGTIDRNVRLPKGPWS
jgi:hypothetical protein